LFCCFFLCCVFVLLRFSFRYRIANAAFSIRCDVTADDIIDVIEGKRVYVPCIYVLNKIDQTTIADLDVLSKCPHYVPVSAQHGWNLDGLVEQIWSYLDLTRIYTKPRVPPLCFVLLLLLFCVLCYILPVFPVILWVIVVGS